MVKPGDRVTADVALNPVPTLQVKVTGDAQNPDSIFVTQKVFGTQNVFGEPASGIEAQTERTPNGDIFLTGLPPGQYVLNINTDGEVSTGWHQTMNLSGNTEVQAKRVMPVTVKGTVSPIDATATGGMINLTNHSTGYSSTVRISNSGEFLLSDDSMTAGAYEVSILNVRDVVISSITATGAAVKGRTIEVSRNTPAVLKVALSRGLGRIDGTAMRGDKPVTGAMIVLVPDDVDNNRSLIRRDQSDSDGTFTLPAVLPGNYTVIALQNGWERDWESATALRPYVKGGTSVSVSANGKYEVKVVVQ
jgi:hypothetical protein